MPKLSDFLPDVVGKNASLTQGNQWLNKLYDMGFTGFLKAQYGSNITSAVQHYGIEQLYFDWLRQAYSYRRMFIQDLYLLAFDSSEIRAPLLQLKKEIFRKGFEEWHPKFEVKCEKCDLEFQSREDAKEHEDHGLRVPDVSQLEVFDKKWRHNCNIFGQDLESVLNELEDDVNICLVPGTKILSRHKRNNFKYVNIEEIEVGTKVWTHTAKLRPVIKVYKRFINETIVVLHLNNDETIRITGNHPVYTTNGWKRADELTVKDVLYKLAEVHPNWSKKLSEKPISVIDYSKVKRNKEKRLATRKFRSDILGVLYSGSKGHLSPKKGKTLSEYYGEQKAEEIIRKQKNTSSEKGSNIGNGINFRSKKGSFNGSNNPNWKGGLSFIEYGLDFTKSLKKKVFERDKFTCQSCGKYSISCQCHHINYNKKDNDSKNLITLCKSCHCKTTAGNRKYWEEKLSSIILFNQAVLQNGTRILKIDREDYNGYVYNLEVEEDHTYVGRGIIYHNCDDLFLRKSKQYRRTADNRFLSQLVELRRIHPALVEFDLDKNGLPKNSHWLCPFHRDDVKPNSGRCDYPDCKEDLLPAMYIYNHRGNRVYLYEDELIHSSKFSPSTTYGYSPILTIMQKILTINGMDRFLYRYFFERKTPTQMILTNTDDPQSLEQERARMESKMMDDPTYTPWIAVSNRTGRGRTDVIKLFHTLHEMDYLRIREEIRDRVAGIYGVPQMFYNVMEGMGGISGQTQQLKMMSNVVSSDQRMFNEKLIPSILKDLGITDWNVRLRTPEEKVEGQVIQLAQQKVMIATQMRQMGFEIKLKSKSWDIDTLDFSFSGKAMSLQEQQQQQMGMTGGMGGMGGDTPVDPSIFEGGEPQEDSFESEEEEFAPRKHRLEEEPYRQLTPDEEDEEEEDNVEEQTWS